MPLRRNGSFTVVDMDSLGGDDYLLAVQVAKELASHIAAGHFRRIPITTFPMCKLHEALELVRSGKHMGKVVVTNYEMKEDSQPVPIPVSAAHVELPRLDDKGAVLVTGGTGGIGSILLRDLYRRGARHFILPTRYGETQSLVSKFRFIHQTPGATIRFIKADLAKEEDVRQVMAMAKQAGVKTIIHAAGISIDATLGEISMDQYHQVAYPKALAAWHLSELSKDMDLHDFVVISSLAALFGWFGIGAYGAANAFLDGLIRYRRSLGLCGYTLNLGSVQIRRRRLARGQHTHNRSSLP